jgi:hypothetical protein
MYDHLERSDGAADHVLRGKAIINIAEVKCMRDSGVSIAIASVIRLFEVNIGIFEALL